MESCVFRTFKKYNKIFLKIRDHIKATENKINIKITVFIYAIQLPKRKLK